MKQTLERVYYSCFNKVSIIWSAFSSTSTTERTKIERIPIRRKIFCRKQRIIETLVRDELRAGVVHQQSDFSWSRVLHRVKFGECIKVVLFGTPL
mmetsp:Transcript_19587/g.22271  ORF Transcript_19587/g.22271 Transcript_19587/m.22271 type:complete len:95 (-) Transcript_19587:2631-2915(-)